MLQRRPLDAGTITSIRAQSRHGDRVSLFIDDEFAFGIHCDLLLEFNLKKGGFLSAEQQSALLQRDQYYRARSLAVQFLGYRPRSEAEVRRRLARGGYHEEVVTDVVGRMRELGYLDDEQYAESYARGRFETAGYGPLRVRADLRKRGVSRETAEATVHRVFADDDKLLAIAHALAEKRWNRLPGDVDLPKRKKRLVDYMLRRGYPYEIVKPIADELADGE